MGSSDEVLELEIKTLQMSSCPVLQERRPPRIIEQEMNDARLLSGVATVEQGGMKCRSAEVKERQMCCASLPLKHLLHMMEYVTPLRLQSRRQHVVSVISFLNKHEAVPPETFSHLSPTGGR